MKQYIGRFSRTENSLVGGKDEILASFPLTLVNLDLDWAVLSTAGTSPSEKSSLIRLSSESP